MKLEEFNRVDIRTGRPCLDWSDKKWQEYYKILQLKVTPSINPNYQRLKCTPDTISANSTYHGKTIYQNYCKYVNDILTNIRLGHMDYCYYIYQIADLLKFEPNLKTRFCGGNKLSPYIEVWL